MSFQTVQYNGYSLLLASVDYSGRVVYDQTDRTIQGIAYTFRGQGIIYATSPTLFQVELSEFESAFAQARKRFLWKFNDGTTFFDISGPGEGGAAVERRNGPNPRVVRVERLAGGISARVSFELECFIYPCGTNKTVEEFWWRFSYSVDRNFSVTRRIVGRYRVGNPADITGLLQDSTLWPKLPKGFFRDSITHTTSSDGLQVDWNITDRQVWRTLPRPLTEGNATFRIEQNMAVVTKTLTCSFAAPVTVPKQVIMQFIINLISARFANILTAPTPGEPETALNKTEYIRTFAIQNYEFENRLDVTVVAQGPAEAYLTESGGTRTIGINAQNLFGDIASVAFQNTGEGENKSDGQAELRGILGTAQLIPSTSSDFNVCGPGTVAASPDQQLSGDSEVGEPGRQHTSKSGNSFGAGAQEDVFRPEHQRYPYVSFIEHWQYITDYHAVVLSPTIKSVFLSPDPDENELHNDIIQRTANPTIRMIQIGSARRIGAPVEIPAPVDSTYEAESQLLTREVRHAAPQVLGDGRTLEYHASWTMVIVNKRARQLLDGNDAITEAGLDMRHPRNPQVGSAWSAANIYSTSDRLIAVQGRINDDGTYIPEPFNFGVETGEG